MKGIFITGTDTDVGKTFVTAGITHVLKSNQIDAVPYKPVQSGAIKLNDKYVSGDIEFVSKICDLKENNEYYNTYALKLEASPHLAFEEDKSGFNIEIIDEKIKSLNEKHDFLVVEGAGGLIVPIKRNDFHVCDLIERLNLNTLVVAKAGLGTINHTCLTVEYLKSKNINVIGIVINYFEDTKLQRDNIKVIEEYLKIPVIAVIEKKELNDENLKNYYNKVFNKKFISRIVGE